MPNSAARPGSAETATKWRGTPASPKASTIQVLAAAALVIVSRVVKVLETTTTRVVAGSSPASTEFRSAGSTLETKCAFGPSQ